MIAINPLTFDICCNAFLTKARYMPLRYFSSCLIREFVAIGRWIRSGSEADGDSEDFLVADRLSTAGFG